jgi:hypothetical protein
MLVLHWESPILYCDVLGLGVESFFFMIIFEDLRGKQNYLFLKFSTFSKLLSTGYSGERLCTKDPKWSDPSLDPAHAGDTNTELSFSQRYYWSRETTNLRSWQDIHI